MKEDIHNFIEKQKVYEEIEVPYSRLRCRCCGVTGVYVGTWDMSNLSEGWASLSLQAQGNDKVFQWLLCPACVKDVKKAAGLK